MTLNAVNRRVHNFLHTDWERMAAERRVQKGLGDEAVRLPLFLQEWVERDRAK